MHKCNDLPGGGELEGVHDPQDLVEVPPGGGGVQQGQLEPLVRPDDEYSPAISDIEHNPDPRAFFPFLQFIYI